VERSEEKIVTEQVRLDAATNTQPGGLPSARTRVLPTLPSLGGAGVAVLLPPVLFWAFLSLLYKHKWFFW